MSISQKTKVLTAVAIDDVAFKIIENDNGNISKHNYVGSRTTQDRLTSLGLIYIYIHLKVEFEPGSFFYLDLEKFACFDFMFLFKMIFRKQYPFLSFFFQYFDFFDLQSQPTIMLYG